MVDDFPPGAPQGAGRPVGAPLSALLEDPDLGLELVVGRPSRLFTSVRWVDREGHRPWLAPGDLRLRVAGEEPTNASLDPALRRAPTALLYALTPSERDLPEALAARCARAGVALMTAPPAVAPQRVETTALRALTVSAAASAMALAAPQGYLLAGLSAPKPERDLLERAHRLTGADLVLLGPWGDVVARAGRNGWRPQQQADSPTGLQGWREGAVRLGGEEALLYRLEVDGRLRGLLVAFGAPEHQRPWLELTRTLLAAAASMRAAEQRVGAAAGAALLEAWLAAPDSGERLAPLLLRHGFRGGAPYRAAVAEAPEGSAPGVMAAGADYLAERHRATLAATDGSLVTWVFAAPHPAPGPGPGGLPLPDHPEEAGGAHAQTEGLRLAAAAAVPDGQALRLGVSEPHAELTAVTAALAEARLALRSAPAGGVAAFGALDPLAWLLRQHEPDLRTFQRGLLGRLSSADPGGALLTTLRVYLDAGPDLSAAAARLGVHVNTLRNRLKRIEELVGGPLTRPETVARLWLATRPAGGE